MKTFYEIGTLSKNKCAVFVVIPNPENKKTLMRGDKLFEGTLTECEQFVEQQSKPGPKPTKKLNRHNLNLDDATFEKAKKIGSGSASEGVRIAVGKYQD